MTITIIPRVVIYVVNYSEERKKKESGVLDTGPFRVSRFRGSVEIWLETAG